MAEVTNLHWSHYSVWQVTAVSVLKAHFMLICIFSFSSRITIWKEIQQKQAILNSAQGNRTDYSFKWTHGYESKHISSLTVEFCPQKLCYYSYHLQHLSNKMYFLQAPCRAPSHSISSSVSSYLAYWTASKTRLDSTELEQNIFCIKCNYEHITDTVSSSVMQQLWLCFQGTWFSQNNSSEILSHLKLCPTRTCLALCGCSCYFKIPGAGPQSSEGICSSTHPGHG